MSRFLTAGSVLTAAILGAAAATQNSELSIITQCATFGGLAGAAMALHRERQRRPDSDRRWFIVTLCTLAGAVIGLCVLVGRALP